MPSHEKYYYTREELTKKWEEDWSGKLVEGYVWMSDSPLQHLWLSPTALLPWEKIHSDHNFIWEASIYEPKKQSIFIKQIDHRWLVTTVKWTENSKEDLELTEHYYLVSTDKGEMKMIIQEAWEAYPDELCQNMTVLRPSWTAFVGFQEIRRKS